MNAEVVVDLDQVLQEVNKLDNQEELQEAVLQKVNKVENQQKVRI